VAIEIVPEPEPDEREALLRALAELDDVAAEPAAYRSPWRRAALEPPEDGELYGDATTRRLRSPGASRA
jgi:hypothetical protein